MSGGSPVGGGFIRQRHSQGYLSGDDLEDDASSAMAFTPAPVPRSRTWSGIANDVVWVASAALIIYWGDRKSNFISLLLRDERIRSMMNGILSDNGIMVMREADFTYMMLGML
ncbi:hypothetical protein ACLOJK_020125 [Asimina triloba]